MSFRFDPNDSDRGRERYPARRNRRDAYLFEQDGFTRKQNGDSSSEGQEITSFKNKTQRRNDGDWDSWDTHKNGGYLR